MVCGYYYAPLTSPKVEEVLVYHPTPHVLTSWTLLHCQAIHSLMRHFTTSKYHVDSLILSRRQNSFSGTSKEMASVQTTRNPPQQLLTSRVTMVRKNTQMTSLIPTYIMTPEIIAYVKSIHVALYTSIYSANTQYLLLIVSTNIFMISGVIIYVGIYEAVFICLSLPL